MKNARTKYGRSWRIVQFSGADTDPANTDLNNQNPPKTEDYKALYEKAQADLVAANKSYAGLQQTLSKEQLAKKATEDSLAALNTQFTEITGIRTTLETQTQTLTSTLSEKDKELKALRLAKVRTGLILKEFPALAEFEADSLIPQPENAVKEDGSIDEEALRTIFKNFQSKVMARADAAKAQHNNGGTPPQPPAGNTSTAQTYLAQANAAASKGDMKTYNENYSKYLDALSKSQ